MIDHRMEALPSVEGSLFARCSPPPLCPLSSSSSNSNSSSADSPPHTNSNKASRELTFPPFPSFAASNHSASVTSFPPFAPRLLSAGSLSFQSSNPFILPFSSSSSSSPFSSSTSPSSSSSTSSSSASFHSGVPFYFNAAAANAPVSAFESTSSFLPSGLSRLYSGSSLSGSSDTDGGLVEAPYLAPLSSADFASRLPDATCDGPLTPSLSSAGTGPPPPPSRSISSTSASSSLSLLSPRPRLLLRGGEREDGALSASAANSDSASSGSLWHCSYGCGKVYRKSSGRSIRRHVVSCFKAHWPGGAELTDSELSTLIAMQQDRGLLVTGLRRWKMRQSRRPAHELTEGEKWRCPWNCGKFYRSTSSRSIQRHATTCPNRAAEHTSSTSAGSDTKRVKRQRDEDLSGLYEDDEEGGLESSDSEGDDNDEAEETTDSGGSARSGNGRLRKSSGRNSHSLSNVSGGRTKAALRLDTQLASSSSSPSSSAQSLSHRSMGQPSGSTASSSAEDVDFLYPDSTTASSTPSSSNAAAGSSSPSYDVLSVQKREVALQLQRLLRDIHRRHGTNHPVFQSPMMTQQLIDGLLNKDVDDAVDDMDGDQHTAAEHRSATNAALSVSVPADGGNSSSSSSSRSRSSRGSRSNRRGSWAALADPGSLLSPSSSSVSSAPPTPSNQSAAASLHWTCACGSSFKITSSKSIQKHRAGCGTHNNSGSGSSQLQQHKQAVSQQEPRIKREKH